MLLAASPAPSTACCGSRNSNSSLSLPASSRSMGEAMAKRSALPQEAFCWNPCNGDDIGEELKEEAGSAMRDCDHSEDVGIRSAPSVPLNWLDGSSVFDAVSSLGASRPGACSPCSPCRGDVTDWPGLVAGHVVVGGSMGGRLRCCCPANERGTLRAAKLPKACFSATCFGGRPTRRPEPRLLVCTPVAGATAKLAAIGLEPGPVSTPKPPPELAGGGGW